MRVAGASYFLGERIERGRFVSHLARQVEPAESVWCVVWIWLPNGMVCVPDAWNDAVCFEAFHGARDRLGICSKLDRWGNAG